MILALGKLRQDLRKFHANLGRHSEFSVSLNYIGRPYIKKQTKKINSSRDFWEDGRAVNSDKAASARSGVQTMEKDS